MYVVTVLIRVDEWDNRLFGINEIEASMMDPQQSMVLECVHMALEDGGITKKQIDGTHTGVYIGKLLNESANQKQSLKRSFHVKGLDTPVGWGLSPSVCCLVHWGSSGDLLLLQISSDVV